MTTRNLSAVEVIKALETHRRNADRTARMIAEGISKRLAQYNATPSAGSYIAELERAETFVREYGTNPVVKTTALRAYPGWVIRQYADGMYAATNGRALSPTERTFQDALFFVKHDRPPIGDELHNAGA